MRKLNLSLPGRVGEALKGDVSVIDTSGNSSPSVPPHLLEQSEGHSHRCKDLFWGEGGGFT